MNDYSGDLEDHLDRLSVLHGEKKVIFTIGHEIGPREGFFSFLVHRKLLRMQSFAETRSLTQATYSEIVRQGELVTRSHLQDLVPAVAKKSRPSDVLS
jgi:hypothetical protein